MPNKIPAVTVSRLSSRLGLLSSPVSTARAKHQNPITSKTAADIWNLIEQGTTRSNIINNLHHNYDCSAIDVADAVEAFLAKIDAEGLIAIVEGELSQEQSLGLPESETSQTKFALPVIEKFTDMEELLLLDPIHEADEDKGWPTAKQAV
ncbi:MAG: PqqD family protein [Cyanobacteria bacterium J06638_38]